MMVLEHNSMVPEQNSMDLEHTQRSQSGMMVAEWT